MRLPRFQELLHRVLTEDGQASVRTFAEAGYAKRPFGEVVELPGSGQVYVQAIRRSPSDGADQKPEEPIAEGEPPAPMEPVTLAGGGTRTADVEAWIAAALANSGHRELARVDRYSTTPDLGSSDQPYGVKVTCHSTAEIHLLFVHTARASQSISADTEWKILETL
ncbi:hypothetical protein GCM10027294_11880 [Marinactinospora endophytica]